MTAFDCRTCGACCASFTTIPVDAHEVIHIQRAAKKARVRTPVVAKDTAHFIGLSTAIVMNHKEGEAGDMRVKAERRNGDLRPRCAALHGTLGVKVRCAIYEARPATCIAFAAGGEDCIAARAARGINE